MPKVSAGQVKRAAMRVTLNEVKFRKAVTQVASLKAGLTAAVLTKATADLLDEIQRESPVDTGRFRGGWTPFLQSLGLPSDIAGPNVTTRAVAEGYVMSDYTDQSERAVDPYIWIRNGVPYGPELEAGKSSQVGSGFVSASLARFASHLSKAARSVSKPRGTQGRDGFGRFIK